MDEPNEYVPTPRAPAGLDDDPVATTADASTGTRSRTVAWLPGELTAITDGAPPDTWNETTAALIAFCAGLPRTPTAHGIPVPQTLQAAEDLYDLLGRAGPALAVLGGLNGHGQPLSAAMNATNRATRTGQELLLPAAAIRPILAGGADPADPLAVDGQTGRRPDPAAPGAKPGDYHLALQRSGPLTAAAQPLRDGRCPWAPLCYTPIPLSRRRLYPSLRPSRDTFAKCPEGDTTMRCRRSPYA